MLHNCDKCPGVVRFREFTNLYYCILSDCLNHDASVVHAFMYQMLCSIKTLLTDL